MNPDLMPSWWDPWSSQPYQMPKQQKPRAGFSNLAEYSKVAATALVLAPLLAARYATSKPTVPPDRSIDDFAGLSLTPLPAFRRQMIEMVEELGAKKLLLRIPCWEASSLDMYDEFMADYPGRDFVINVLQSRDSVSDPDSFYRQLEAIFKRFGKRVELIQLGNAINRSKWGCRHSGDWLGLMDAVQQIRKEYAEVPVAGSSVIDFEPLVSLRTLFNLHPHNFDVCAALLYVNRRGSPFGRQYRYFNLERKIRLTHAMTAISNKCPKRLWISETNWPLLNTKPWTPNSGHPRSTVDEPTQAKYLTEYYQIAWHCGLVERVYWWQLINPGYGLVDHRHRKLRKMPSYDAFKRLFEGEILEKPVDPLSQNP